MVRVKDNPPRIDSVSVANWITMQSSCFGKCLDSQVSVHLLLQQVFCQPVVRTLALAASVLSARCPDTRDLSKKSFICCTTNPHFVYRNSHSVPRGWQIAAHPWSPVPVVLWSSGSLVLWSSGLLFPWSSGPLVTRGPVFSPSLIIPFPVVPSLAFRRASIGSPVRPLALHADSQDAELMRIHDARGYCLYVCPHHGSAVLANRIRCKNNILQSDLNHVFSAIFVQCKPAL